MILVLILKITSLIPLRILHLISRILAIFSYYTGIYRKKVVLGNLKLAFPEKSQKEIKKICRDFYSNFFDVIVEGIKFYSISNQSISKRFIFKNEKIILENTNKNIFLFLGHYSNWEWFPYFSYINNSKKNIDSYAIYLALKNKKSDDYIKKIRIRFHLKLIEKYKLARTILKNLKSENQNMYGLLIDQSPHISEINGFIDFLGLRTPVDFTLDKLSRKLDVAVFFVDIKRVKRGYYQSEFIKITDEASKEEPENITKEYYNLLEKKIKENPSEWLWTHRRWKHMNIQLCI